MNILGPLLATCIILFGTCAAFSQEAKVFAGIHLTSIERAEGNQEMNSRLGLHLGGNYNFYLVGQLSFSPGIEYIHRKGSIDYHNTPTFDFSYLDANLYGRYKINEMFAVFAGPYVGFNEANNTAYNGNVEAAKDTDDIILGIGVGVEVFLGRRFSVDGFIKQGFTEMWREGSIVGESPLDIGLSASLHFM